jgi:leucine dehydrogenase
MLFDRLGEVGLERLVVVSDPSSGLRALVAIHDTTLGPAAGGVRTRRYPDEWAALAEVASLARTMTYKCALVGLPCGGGKAVVLDHDGLDRQLAFERLGAAVQELGGLFRTAGDLGTRVEDLRAMARRCHYVHHSADGLDLEGATARGVVLALGEAVRFLGAGGLRDLDIIVQGAGAVGSRVVAALAHAGARVRVADVRPDRAEATARASGATTIDAALAMATPCDVFSPCAAGGVIDRGVAEEIPCRVICGAANNPLCEDVLAQVLAARRVLFVPDFVAGAGAVAEGIGTSILALDDRAPLVDRIAEVTREVLTIAAERSQTPLAAARELAHARLAAARSNSGRPI